MQRFSLIFIISLTLLPALMGCACKNRHTITVCNVDGEELFLIDDRCPPATSIPIPKAAAPVATHP